MESFSSTPPFSPSRPSSLPHLAVKLRKKTPRNITLPRLGGRGSKTGDTSEKEIADGPKIDQVPSWIAVFLPFSPSLSPLRSSTGVTQLDGTLGHKRSHRGKPHGVKCTVKTIKTEHCHEKLIRGREKEREKRGHLHIFPFFSSISQPLLGLLTCRSRPTPLWVAALLILQAGDAVWRK